MTTRLKRLHIATCVWGRWHIEAFGRIALPTLLAAGNIPAIRENFDVRYRFFTTAPDRARIEGLALFRDLAALVPVEIVTPIDEEHPETTRHVEWYHAAIAGAKDDGAVVAFAPPDVVWSDGTFGAMARVMASGKKGCAMPYLRVVSETIDPFMSALSDSGRRVVALNGRETVALGLEHFHPLSAAAVAGAPHTRPTLEVLFPVRGEGLVLGHAVRELFAFDPSRMTPSYLWYAEDIDDPEDIHFVRTSDEMMMLSLAPLLKDFGDIGIYIPDRRPTPFDPAASSRHPLNDTPLTLDFMARPVRLAATAPTEALWRGAERRTAAFMRRSAFHWIAMGLCAAMRATGAGLSADLIAWAALRTPLARWFADRGPYLVLAPDDQAWGDLPSRIVSNGDRALLRAFVHAHVGKRTEPDSARLMDGRIVRIENGRISLDGKQVAEVTGRQDARGHLALRIDAPLPF